MGGYTQFTQSQEEGSRWRPVMIAGAIIVVIVALVWVLSRGRQATPSPNAPPPAYASNLQLGELHLSTAQNFVGGEITYIEGKIANRGDKTLTSALVETVFRNDLGEIVDRQTQPLQISASPLGTPDWVALNRAPLGPGKTAEFRLSFEHISADWNRGYPELRVVSLKAQ